MHVNVGSTDRLIRLIIGIIIIGLGVYFQSWWGVVGIVPLLTATLKWCPAYIPLGLNTGKSDRADTHT